MSDYPNRGPRKCGTCLFFTSHEDEWNKDCKLDACECKAQEKEFGRALCDNYKGRTYVDTSGLGLAGPVAGHCDIKLPPILNQLLWGKQRNRLTSKEDWCHLWQPIPAGPILQRSPLDGFLVGTPATVIEDQS